jgi:hypothetical protein
LISPGGAAAVAAAAARAALEFSNSQPMENLVLFLPRNPPVELLHKPEHDFGYCPHLHSLIL